jgi:hypothetical protein
LNAWSAKSAGQGGKAFFDVGDPREHVAGACGIGEVADGLGEFALGLLDGVEPGGVFTEHGNDLFEVDCGAGLEFGDSSFESGDSWLFVVSFAASVCDGLESWPADDFSLRLGHGISLGTSAASSMACSRLLADDPVDKQVLIAARTSTIRLAHEGFNVKVSHFSECSK